MPQDVCEREREVWHIGQIETCGWSFQFWGEGGWEGHGGGVMEKEEGREKRGGKVEILTCFEEERCEIHITKKKKKKKSLIPSKPEPKRKT